MKTKLSDIKITRAFKNTHPNPEKLLKCMTYYAKHGKLDRDIVLSKDNVLVDGYVGYLTLVALGVKKYKCIKDNSYQWFVQGKSDVNFSYIIRKDIRENWYVVNDIESITLSVSVPN